MKKLINLTILFSLTILPSRLLATDIYTLDNFPLNIPGWEFTTNPDGSVYLLPKTREEASSMPHARTNDKEDMGANQNSPPQTQKSIPDDFPDAIPGWEVIDEPDGSKLLIPQITPNAQIYTDEQLSAMPDFVTEPDMPEQDVGDMTETPNLLKDFPDEIPGWIIINEPDGSKLLFPQKTIDRTQQRLQTEKSAADTDRTDEPASTSYSEDRILDNFPNKIPGWLIVEEPDGSRLLYPQYPPEYEPDNISPPGEESTSQRQLRKCFELNNYPYYQPDFFAPFAAADECLPLPIPGAGNDIWRIENY